uniref:Transmembrane protein n=1 Tax=Davidia involucrata TaxID=16924 RepID=A0A5B6Z174_DAVIN
MGTQNLFMPKSHFDFVDKGFLSEFLYKTMFRFVNSIWVFICNFLFHLFGFIVKYIFRSQKNDLDYSVVHSQQNDQFASSSSTNSEPDGFGEKENREFSFRFQLAETESSVFLETNKYQFISGKDFSGFIEKPETMSFTVQELFLGSNDDSIVNNQNQDTAVSVDKDFQQLQVGSNDAPIGNDQSKNTKFSAENDFQELNLKAENVDQEKAEDSVESLCKEEISEKQEQISSNEHEAGLKSDSLGKPNFSDEVELRSGNHFMAFDSKPESNSSIDGFSIGNNKINSISTEFFTD